MWIKSGGQYEDYIQDRGHRTEARRRQTIWQFGMSPVSISNKETNTIELTIIPQEKKGLEFVANIFLVVF